MRYYEKIDGSKYRNIWVVGDLHGCYTNLMNKLDTIGFDNKKDLLISVGDFRMFQRACLEWFLLRTSCGLTSAISQVFEFLLVLCLDRLALFDSPAMAVMV